jgi:hypothetical protein
MVCHALSKTAHPPSPRDTGSLSHVRSLERSYSNISQASTLVGSESDGNDDAQSPSATRAPLAVQHGAITGLHSHEPCAPHQANIDIVVAHQNVADRPTQMECERTRQSAAVRLRWLHRICDPFMDMVQELNETMGQAERLYDAGDRRRSYALYEEIIQDPRLPKVEATEPRLAPDSLARFESADTL